MHSKPVEELVAIAKVIRPRGLKGEVVAELLTDFPERFEELEQVIGLKPNGERLDLKIDNSWFQKERVILKFERFDSIEEAETLRDTEVCVPESEVVELERDEYFDWQLIECKVETVEGVELGKVREVMRTGGTEILVVEDSGREYLLPFAESICVEVDVEKKLIVVDPPEGLLEF